LINDVIKFNDIKPYSRPVFTDFIDYDAISYFDSWLIGYIEAKGSFSVISSDRDAYRIANVEISQSCGSNILYAIKRRLKFNSNPKKASDADNRGYELKASSIRSVQNIINFIFRNQTKLIGFRRIQFINWIKEVKLEYRYKSLNIPDNY
jgi:ubiquinol-cytochrome c reductase cytochrome b subunit